MIDVLLVMPSINLLPVIDAIDIYEGSIPPSATFQVIDVDNITEASAPASTGDGNAN